MLENIEKDEMYMRRCLELAVHGMGHVAPNPMVGSVIVCEDRIIGEGYHHSYGGPHAEVNAIASVKDKSLLKKSTLYVNLEPCSHHGKTPPCSNLILEMGIPRVVIGSTDSNPQVAGKGMERLRKGGCEVTSGILEADSRKLNKRFYTFHEKKRPFIILKWAQTLDGFIDVIRAPGNPAEPTWITNDVCRVLVHKWRSEEMAIMAGTNTVEKDNPELTVRQWSGKNPFRVILDRSLRLSASLKVFNDQADTLILNQNREAVNKNLIYRKINFGDDVPAQILKVLREFDINSVIIEGGRQLLQSFIDQNLWDEARVFIGQELFVKGIPSPELPCLPVEKTLVGNSTLLYFQNQF